MVKNPLADWSLADAPAEVAGCADAVVLFGATGDLARKKLFPALYRLAKRGRPRIPIVGVARSDWDDDQLRDHAREAAAADVGTLESAAFAECFCALAGGDLHLALPHRDLRLTVLLHLDAVNPGP